MIKLKNVKKSHLPKGTWFKHAGYVPYLAFAMGLMMLRPLLMAQLLEPSQFATYSAGLLISSTFCMLGCLGLQPLLQRQMPMNLIAGKEISSLVLLVQSMFVAMACLVVSIGIGIYSAPLAGLNSEGVIISLLHGFSQQVFVLVTIESRSRGEPLRFSLQNLSRASLVIAGAFFVAWALKAPEIILITEAILSLLVSWCISAKLFKFSPVKFKFLLRLASRKRFNIRWADSFALMSVMVVGFTLANVDRWFAASYLLPSEFGAYALAWILITASQSFQTIINSSVYPVLAKRYRIDGRASSFKLASRFSFLLLCAGTSIAIPASYILNASISSWFTSYQSAVQLVPVFMAVAVIRLSDFWSSHLIISGKERLLLAINVSVGLIVLSMWLGLQRFDILPYDLAFRLAWLALVLSACNYACVVFAAVKFRR